MDYEEPPLEWLTEFLPRSAKGWCLVGSEVHRPDWFLGANWAAMVTDLRDVGGFDDGFGPGSVASVRGQETNMQARMRGIGLSPRYIPGAIVYHYVPKERCSLEWLLDRRRRDGKGFGLRSNKKNMILRFAIFFFAVTSISYNYLKICIYSIARATNRISYFNTRISYYYGVLSGIKVL